MNFSYQHLLPEDFNASSRVWIYQSSRMFTLPESLRIEKLLNRFVSDWKSHSTPVKGYANLLFGHFVIIMADEAATAVSGCSTDSSVRAIKQIEQEFNAGMFDRQLLAFAVKDKVELLPLSQLKHAVEKGSVHADTIYFNNHVSDKKDLLTKWMIPIKDSWLKTRIKSFAIPVY